MHLDRSIDRFLADRAARGCAVTTLQTYSDLLRLLSRFLKSHRVRRTERVTVKHLTAFLAEMHARQLSPVTIRKRAKSLRTFFKFLRQIRQVRRDPSAALPMPKDGKRRPKTLAPRDIRKLFDRARWNPDGNEKRDYAILLLMLDSGLRLSEIANLRAGDFDLARGLVHVRHGKGDKERWSVFTKRTARAIQSIAPRRDNVFALSSLAIYRMVKRRGKQTGVHATPHMLRHTWLTEFLNNGGPLHVAQVLAGHEDIRQTIQYTTVAPARIARAYAQFSPLRMLESDSAR